MIDVFITSASRPLLLRKTLESFLDKVMFSGTFRFFVNEDYVIPDESTVCLGVLGDLLKQYHLKCNNPPIGLSGAFLYFSKYFSSPYMFYLQDDWELIRVLHLDNVLSMINSWSDIMPIAQLRFNKRKTMPYKGERSNPWHKDEVRLGEHILTTSDSIYLNPALWNMEFFRPFLTIDFTGKPHQRPFIWKLNECVRAAFQIKKGSKTEFSRTVGTYIYGGIGEAPYFRHLGKDERMQLKSGVW